MGDNARRVRRLGRRRQIIPEGARCGRCGTTEALTRKAEGYFCYRCLGEALKRHPYEAHHVFGRDLHDATIRVDPNVHRMLEEAKYTWPEAANDPELPLPFRLLIRLLLTLRDLARLLILLGQQFVEWLLDLARKLKERHGARWDVELGLRPFTPSV